MSEEQRTAEAATPLPPEEQARRARRRRLLKGLLAASAAPAVVTLGNSAQAAVASNYNCIVNNSNAKTPPVTPAGVDRCVAADDEWYRLTETAMTGNADIDGDTNNDEYCLVYVDDNGVLAPANDTWIDNYGGDGGFNEAPASTPATSKNYYALHDSCWNSFSVT